MKNILIIGCGLLGSSLLRRISKTKIAKKIFIYEKSKSNITKIKKLRLPGVIVKSLKVGVVNSDLIIFCTPTSEYKGLILKINNFISPKTLITDVGSSKTESSKIIKKFLKNKKDKTNGTIDFINGQRGFLSRSIYNIVPKERDLIIFPNYLMHTAYPFNINAERRSFSFNAKIILNR